MAIPGNAETLERLLIEIVGDDSSLKTVLDEAVKAAQKAAAEMRDSLNLDWSKVTQGAQQAATAFDSVAPAVKDVNSTFDQFVTGSQRAFDDVRRAGRMTTEQFEAYRKTALEAIETQRPLAQSLGYTGAALDDLAKHVREAAYEQSQASRETERTKQEQEELEAVIKRLSNEVRSSRNAWRGRITDDKEFEQSTEAAREELVRMLSTVERGSDEYRKITQSIGFAQAGLDSMNKVASRGGIAWTTQIALANQFGQQLRGLGPAGNIAAGGLGLLSTGFANLQRPLTAADFQLSKIGASLLRLPGLISLAGAALTVGLGVGLTRLTTQAAQYARELENATYRTGLTVEGLQELQHAARSTGVPLDLLNTTMQRLQRRAADANAGNEGLRKSFQQLGVTLTDEHGRMRTTEDLLGQVADGLNRVESDAERLALAFKVFDTEGGRLLPLLAEGSEGIRTLREEARELGLVISGDTIMSLSEFHAELESVSQQFKVLTTETAAAFLPVLRDGILPLVRDQLVPWLGNLATRITEFSDRLFDASAEGTEFREELAKSLQVLVSFGQGVVIAAQAVNALVQGILSGVANLGAFLGTAFADVDFKAIEQGFRDQEETYLRLQREVAENPLKFNVEPWSDEHRQLMQDYGEKAAEAAQAAAEASGGRFGQAWKSAVENEMGQGFAEGSINAVQSALAAFDFDLAEMLEGWARDGADRATRPTREALTEFINDTFGGLTNEPPPPGSIAAAEAMVRHYAEAFRNASTDEARITAATMRDEWQGVVDAMLAPFNEADALAAGRAWTQRLTAELRHGEKTAQEVLGLLEAGVDRLRVKLDEDYSAFGWDSEDYQATLARLNFLEEYLERFRREHGVVTIDVEVGAVVLPEEPSALPDATLPEQTKSAAAALVEYYTRLTRVTEAQAKLHGVTASTRDNYQETVDILESILPGLDEMSDDYLAVVALLTQARDRLREVDDLLTDAPTSFLVDGLRAAATAAGTMRDAIQDAQASSLRRELEGIANAAGSVLSVTRGVRGDGILASLLGEDFDETAAEMRHLERVVRDLGGRYDELTTAERIRLTLASNRLQALKEQTQAERDAADATQAHKTAVEEWNAAVMAMGASEDPLLARAQQLDAWLAEGAITLEEYTAMLAEVAAAQERLNATMSDGAFDAWAEGVNRLGVTLDPVSIALGDLGALMAAGTITAEEYAAGVDMVNAALDRLEQAAADAEIEKITAAWETAATQLGDRLGIDLFDVIVSEWDAMREAAQAAFDAGVIGAEELAKALELIGILEVADGFRQVAAELDGLQALVPTLAADLTEAFAQFTAGNTAGAVATAFNAATNAVQSLGAAFDDTANQGEAMLDLVIGAAAGIATAIGGPAMGQAVGAIGGFIKSILGDLSNGLAAIEKEINATASRSRYLGENLVRGIAEGATQTVSRGGLLGLLGFTKQELDDDAFRAGVALAESLASGMVNTLRSGDFEEAWQAFIDDIIINGIIEAFIATALVQDAIEEAMELIMGGDAAGGAAALDRLKNDFHQVWRTIQGITSTPLPDQDELERSVVFSLPDATVSVLAAPQWALELEKAASSISDAGSAMLSAAETIQGTFEQGITVVPAPSPRGIDAARSL